jgi:hypothetical protein
MAAPHPALDDARVLVGQTIADRYRVDAVLGAGGMGAVFRCHHLALRRDVAVKILHPELTADPEVAPRFDREAQSASRLEHPNIMQVFDYGSWMPRGASTPIKYMVMQLLAGSELADALGQPLPPARAVALMLQIVRGLEHAHERGVVHRDLKPENVYVTTDHAGAELLKLVDFGIAKVVGGEGAGEKLTRMGLVFGTPHYMSPEQATGMEVDARADLYSAGIILYEMLAGHVPFSGDDPVAVIRMQVGAPAPPLPAHVPPALVAIVERMLEKDRERRFPTATQVREALERMATDLARMPSAEAATVPRIDVVAPTISVVAPLRPWRAPALGVPSWALALIAGGAALVVVLAIVVAVRGENEPPPAPAASAAEAPAVGIGGALAAIVQSGASDEDLRRLDRLVATRSDAEALPLLDSLLAAHPTDARLHWRQGRILARDPERATAALAAYRRALEQDASLLERADFYAELLDAMRKPGAGGDALELALSRLGEHGHPYLLELVNREAGALGHADRHRALAVLEADEDMATLVDRRLNVIHDLWQASTTARPCEVFDRTLRAMELVPDARYVGSVHKVKVPKPGAAEDPTVCQGLDARIMKLRLDLSARFPAADEERWIPADYKPRKKKRRGWGGFWGG